jgi:hypothetical protein
MSWNFKKYTFEDKVLRISGMISIGLWSYYEQFEPTKLQTLKRRLNEIEQIANQDEAAASKELDSLIEIWEEEVKRNSAPAHARDIKSLHATKEQLGICEQHYRDILSDVSAKTSSRDLKH